jgi:hypothetical protein
MRGAVIAVPFACAGGGPASGVRIATNSGDPAIRLYYNDSPTDTETKAEGPVVPSAGFYNVPLGTIVLTATPIALGKVSSTAAVTVKPGALTVVEMLPTP